MQLILMKDNRFRVTYVLNMDMKAGYAMIQYDIWWQPFAILTDYRGAGANPVHYRK